MKVLTAAQTREADQYTIQHEPIASIDLMERASSACTEWLLSTFGKTHYSIYCGTGNNGGDGLAIARMLTVHGADVTVWLVRFSDQLSEDNAVNLQRARDLGLPVHEVKSASDLHPLHPKSVIVDALFGTGLSRSISGLPANVVDFLNRQDAVRVAIDVPSGLFTEAENETDDHPIFQANHTLTFESPKLSFLLPSSFPFVGEWHILDIGLDKSFIASLESPFLFLEKSDVQSRLHIRSPFSHKGTFGHALIASGSYGKVGAAVLCSKAALRSGAGLVSAFVPKCAYDILQTAVPEVMVMTSEHAEVLSGSIASESFSSIGVGPGLGQAKETLDFLKALLTNANYPCVLDADALNLIADHKTLLEKLPEGSILTPHVKEFDRLFGKQTTALSRLNTQRDAARQHHICIILKGRYSSVAFPDGTVWFNSTGNPGMATAGSGDVLTGILTALLAQGYSTSDAALIGVYLHGLSADLCLQHTAQEALIASDIIEGLGNAYRFLQDK